MLTLFSLLLIGAVILTGLMTIVFVIEVCAALMARHPSSDWSEASRGRVAVLVPAHNESSGVLPTIADIRAQLRAGDRLLVVADNCTDDTAAVARGAGAEVVERANRTKIGKGYALDFGLRHLAAEPPDTVIIVDADCRLGPGTVDLLARASGTTNRPVQSLDLMTAPAHAAVNHKVAEFAWRVKNWVRPLGMQALGLPCQLMGTGMAFPWPLVRSAELASGRIVEDLKLGLDLAALGAPPLFCPSALVTSAFPLSEKGATSQRERWESGHLSMIFSAAPRLVLNALRQGNVPLLALALDMAVPPLTLLALLIVSCALLSGVAFALGGSTSVFVASSCLLLAFASAVFAAWLRYGRDVLPAAAATLLVPYVLKKVLLYAGLAMRRGALQWKRTDRG